MTKCMSCESLCVKGMKARMVGLQLSVEKMRNAEINQVEMEQR